MKQKVGPVAIIIGVVFVMIFCVVAYRWAFAPQSPPASRNFMPDYAKTRDVKPGDEGKSGASDGSASSSNAPSYGQGYGQRSMGGRGGMSGSPQNTGR